MSPRMSGDWVEGYLIMDRSSGFIRGFRRSVVAAFVKGDQHPGSLIMMVRIPADQELIYRRAEVARGPGPTEEQQSRTQLIRPVDPEEDK